jgi:hypothetical protein
MILEINAGADYIRLLVKCVVRFASLANVDVCVNARMLAQLA